MLDYGQEGNSKTKRRRVNFKKRTHTPNQLSVSSFQSHQFPLCRSGTTQRVPTILIRRLKPKFAPTSVVAQIHRLLISRLRLVPLLVQIREYLYLRFAQMPHHEHVLLAVPEGVAFAVANAVRELYHGGRTGGVGVQEGGVVG